MSLFSVGAIQNPIKHIPAAEAVSGHTFNMLLQKTLAKRTPKGVCFIRFWIAPTSKNGRQNPEKEQNHKNIVQNHNLAKREKNLKIDAPRCALVNFGSHF